MIQLDYINTTKQLSNLHVDKSSNKKIVKSFHMG